MRKKLGGRVVRLVSAVLLTGVSAFGAGSWTTGTASPVPTTPPGIEAWQAERGSAGPLPDPAADPPDRVAAFFARTTEVHRDALAVRHPGTLGNLDGAPAKLRYEANARAIRAERTRRLAEARDESLPGAVRDQARARAARFGELLLPGRRFLAFDPRGRGQLAEVYGDMETASRIAVVVPGSGIDLMSFDRAEDGYGTPSTMAKALRVRMAEVAPSETTAVVAWAGYTTPSGLDAATGGPAEAGAPRLVRLLSGLVSTGAPPPTVLCHSYGAVVCGLAARQAQPGAIGDLVFVAAPGTGAAEAADLATDARVWAARSTSDWIRHVAGVDVFGLGHGTDPTDPAYGARPVPTARVTSHTGYFMPGSDALAAFADIALGREPGPAVRTR